MTTQANHKDMVPTQMNPTQLMLLQMFSFDPTEETKRDLQTILSNYYFEKLDKMGSEIWQTMSLTPEKLDEMCSIHEHTFNQ